MVVKIDYGELASSATALNKAAKYCGDYASRLRRKVPNELDNLTRGSSNYTSSASYFASAKIQSLEKQQQKCLDVSGKIDTFIKDAKSTDQRVAGIIKKEGNEFRKANGLSFGWSDGLMQVISRFAIDAVNKSSLTRWIDTLIRDRSDAFNAWLLDKKHWFACEGGKYKIMVWVKRFALVAAALAAFAAMVVAFPAILTAIASIASVGLVSSLGLIWSAFAATCTMITTCIALADATISLNQTERAMKLATTDPGWAARYADISSTTEYLRKTYFGSEWDKTSMKLAKWIDVVSIVCGIVTFANYAVNGYKFFTGKYRANAKGVKHFKVWDTDGKFSVKKMIKNWKHNLKTLDYAFTHDFQYTQWVGARKRNHATYATLEKMKKHWTYKTVKTFFDKLGDGVEWVDKYVV